MLQFLLRRILAVLPVLFVVSLVVFLILRLAPGDPAAVIAGNSATHSSGARRCSSISCHTHTHERHSLKGEKRTGFILKWFLTLLPLCVAERKKLTGPAPQAHKQTHPAPEKTPTRSR
jgi:ABC-type dipeptide/oligopeptide/nickel transport system permease component